MKTFILTTIVVAVGILFVSDTISQTAKIGMKKAKEIAMHQVTGKIKSSELEKENGKLIYSFDIRNSKGTITEVTIDAYTGAVISTEEESAEKEAAEKQAERAEKKKSKNR